MVWGWLKGLGFRGFRGLRLRGLGIMEKKMETTIMGSYRDNGKADGNYYNGVR